jgi:glycerol-3-phosphate acyltransferase PlsX
VETIALDLMGGDQPAEVIADGAFEASRQYGVRVALVGPRGILDRQVLRASRNGATVIPVDASQVVAMNESPADAWRGKKDSSIAVGIGLLRDGKADAFVSAGNTGAIVAAAMFSLKAMENIDRPAIATLFTTASGDIALVLDIGANLECRPVHLAQFGQLGSDFMSTVFKMERPRVAIVSVGEEENKGTRRVKEAHQLLKSSDLNFVGNVEGFDVPRGVADVIVTDGFTGNVMLKLAESLTESFFTALKGELTSSLLARTTKIFWGPSVKSVAKKWDYSDDGGAPLLGVNGNIIMAHGRSDARDIKNAIGLAKRMAHEGWWRGPAAQEDEKSREHPRASKSAGLAIDPNPIRET